MTVIDPQPLSRKLLHTRQVHCTGYLRSDGLFDIEGRLLDIKTTPSSTPFKDIPTGEPFHQMVLVMTVDIDFVIQNVRACTEIGPTPHCVEVNSAYAALKGVKIGPGFKKQVARIVGGALGCTHLTELLGPMATTLYQTTYKIRNDAELQRASTDPNYNRPKPWVIGTCHVYREDSEATRLIWPEGFATPALSDH